MAGRKKATPSQAEVVRELIRRERVVTVDGTEIKLRPPQVAEAMAVRQLALDMRDEEDGAASGSLVMAGAAVAACVEGIDPDTGARLVLVSGGEMGELTQTALALCGLGATMLQVEAGDADRPT